ncbi:MAG: DUF4432 family protein [Roseiflexaceae bacterium]|jgi:hypothetical protein|nr:DUF4432 family protein [Chloroflexaceae bacterium]
MSTVIHLSEQMFREKRQVLVGTPDFVVETFLFDSGVAGLQISNTRGHIVMLPYQGQQIWSAQFDGRELGMKSMFSEPQPTTTYLHTYGGFFIHCGATRMGVPGPTDHHPLHGELPNARYQKAWLTLGTDERGNYVAIAGSFRHTVAFNDNYVATPEVRLYANQTLFTVTMRIHNDKNTPMDLMYLAHINYRPVDMATLHTSAPTNAEAIRVRKSIPSHISPPAGYRDFIESLAQHPEHATVLHPDLGFNPEVVFTIHPNADANGWAHSAHVHPDGGADYVAHRPDQLPFTIRWISRTPDQDCLGFAMPATAEPEGYTAEKAKGNIRHIAALQTWQCDFIVGTLDAPQTTDVLTRIQALQ